MVDLLASALRIAACGLRDILVFQVAGLAWLVVLVWLDGEAACLSWISLIGRFGRKVEDVAWL